MPSSSGRCLDVAGNHTRAELLDYVASPEVFRFDARHFARPTRPGLGVESDEKAVRAADGSAPDWRGPVWRHPGGSFAEW